MIQEAEIVQMPQNMAYLSSKQTLDVLCRQEAEKRPHVSRLDAAVATAYSFAASVWWYQVSQAKDAGEIIIGGAAALVFTGCGVSAALELRRRLNDNRDIVRKNDGTYHAFPHGYRCIGHKVLPIDNRHGLNGHLDGDGKSDLFLLLSPVTIEKSHEQSPLEMRRGADGVYSFSGRQQNADKPYAFVANFDSKTMLMTAEENKVAPPKIGEAYYVLGRPIMGGLYVHKMAPAIKSSPITIE